MIRELKYELKMVLEWERRWGMGAAFSCALSLVNWWLVYWWFSK
jgi:hypothetical protein